MINPTNYDARLSSIHDGYEYYHSLDDKYRHYAGRYFIFLFSDDDEINRWTLYFLPVLRYEMNVTEFLIVTPHIEKFDDGIYECRVPYLIHGCGADEMSAISAYFYCIDNIAYRRNNDRVIINGAPGIRSERLKEYIGLNSIGKREAVALATLLFSRVPTDREVEDAVLCDTAIKASCIDWTDHGCRRSEDRPIFPDSIDGELDRLILNEKIKRNDSIAIFSVTKATEHIIDRLRGYNIVSVLDNDNELEGSFCRGVEVYTPARYLSGEHRDGLKIIVATRSYVDICEQLHKLGYLIDEQVFVTYVEYEPYGIRRISDDFRRGREIYDDIRRRYPSERLYFITYAGIGDTYLAGMYLADRMKYDGVGVGAVIFITDVCRRVFSVLDHGACVSGEYVIGDNDDAMRLLLYIKQVGYDRLNVCNLTHSYDLIDPGYLRGYKGLDFNTMLQTVSYHAPLRKSRVRVLSEKTDDVFKKHALAKGRTVLISPYARSVKSVTKDFWSEMVSRLKNMGYDVCTNVSGDESGIEDTIPLSLSIEQVYDFVEKAGCFIGLRSGLCDLISGAKAKKIILYSLTQTWGTDYSLDFFGLKNMGLADDDTYELIIDEDFGTGIDRIAGCIRGYDE